MVKAVVTSGSELLPINPAMPQIVHLLYDYIMRQEEVQLEVAAMVVSLAVVVLVWEILLVAAQWMDPDSVTGVLDLPKN